MEELLKKIENLNIKYKILHYEAVTNVEESMLADKDLEGLGTKTLFLKDKKQNFYIYVTKEDSRADLKGIQTFLNCTRLSFTNDEEVFEHLKIKNGLSPLSIIKSNNNVILLLDGVLEEKVIKIHPNVNTATISLRFEDLLKIIKSYEKKYLIYK